MVLAQSLDTLVSIGLPVRNGVKTLEGVIKSVLAQDHENLELVISDNCSTDGTEDLCRELALRDSRVVYIRQPTNVGLLNNFAHVTRLARGAFLRWIGDDDWLAPTYISRCLAEFADDSRLTLVTTQIDYVRPDGTTYTLRTPGTTFRSNDPIQRFEACSPT
jgi:glycosyltransferase involved in cell wall biosynthesis